MNIIYETLDIINFIYTRSWEDWKECIKCSLTATFAGILPLHFLWLQIFAWSNLGLLGNIDINLPSFKAAICLTIFWQLYRMYNWYAMSKRDKFYIW